MRPPAARHRAPAVDHRTIGDAQRVDLDRRVGGEPDLDRPCDASPRLVPAARVTAPPHLERPRPPGPSGGRHARWCRPRRRRRAAARRRPASGTPAAATGSRQCGWCAGAWSARRPASSVANTIRTPAVIVIIVFMNTSGTCGRVQAGQPAGQQAVGRTIQFERTTDLDGRHRPTRHHGAACARTFSSSRSTSSGATRCRAPGTRWCAPRTSTRSPRRGAPRPPLRAGRAVRARPRRALHGHVPDEQPRRRQRHAARLPLRQRRPRRRSVPATTPVMFGYTDQGADPRRITDPDDPRLSNWEGVLPGFEELLCLDERHAPWLDVAERARLHGRRRHRPRRSRWTPSTNGPAEHSVTQFLTDHFLTWLDRAGRAVVRAHLVHPPAPAVRRRRPLRHDVRPRRLPAAAAHPRASATACTTCCSASTGSPPRPTRRRSPTCSAQYYGMISEVDASPRPHLATRSRPAASGTTRSSSSPPTTASSWATRACMQKCGCFESSYHIIGIVRDPAPPGRPRHRRHRLHRERRHHAHAVRGHRRAVPLQCDGLPLTPFLRGERPDAVAQRGALRVGLARHVHPDAACTVAVGPPARAPQPRRAAHRHARLRAVRRRRLAVLRPGRRPDVADTRRPTRPSCCRSHRQMLVWRQQHLDRTLTGMLLRKTAALRPAVPDRVYALT